jgi:UDP-2,3-diacylglucosamine pyrophosphatase LpxH
MISHRTRKAFLTPAMRRSIEHYVSFCCRPGKVAGVIFGHTHKPGKTTLQKGGVRHVWNSGTFLKESASSPSGSFLTIRHDRRTDIEHAVQVHQL